MHIDRSSIVKDRFVILLYGDSLRLVATGWSQNLGELDSTVLEREDVEKIQLALLNWLNNGEDFTRES